MDGRREFALDEALQQLLGYLNFSEGRPDPRFQRALNEAYDALRRRGEARPWEALAALLRARLADLHAGGAPAFRDVGQASAALDAAFTRTLPAYRRHHADLLFHLPDDELYRPYFLARVAEAVLALRPAGEDPARVAADAVRSLSDYVGHRPVAVLESRPRGEPYAHERVRPVPVYLKGAGPECGRYHDLLALALKILGETDPALLAEAHFDPDRLDELAFDPRAYDHGHPANRRPNYLFGEWDPHLIDGKGFYRRFVVRKVTLDAIAARAGAPGDRPPEELLYEAAAVLAGVILMASGISGGGPGAHDSSVTLARLIPRIARNRDAFYQALLGRLGGPHGERLRQEAQSTRQPFGGARQALNQYLARHRAAQLQQRHLALLMAELGYPEASRRQAAKIPAASVRMLSEVHIRLQSGQRAAEGGRLREAAAYLPEVEEILRRGIDCGALVDPWNILGFGGLFPLFQATEDSVRDPRIDELVAAVERTFNLYARLLSEAAAAGERELGERLAARLKQLAAWWDRFATYEVGDVRRVHGGEAATSAERVATALRLWHERGESAADLAFWREHLEGFRQAKAYALVVDALLHKEDHVAALGLLVHWLSQSGHVPLEDGEYSLHALAMRWMLGICRSRLRGAAGGGPAGGRPGIVAKFFDYLEANAEDYWNVPRLEILGIPLEQAEGGEPGGDEDDVYGAAYEGVTYKDSTDDDVDAEVLEVGPQPEFDLEVEGERIEKHLRFLSTVARLWNIATRATAAAADRPAEGPGGRPPEEGWLDQALRNYQGLLGLLDTIHDHPIPAPAGNYESLVEFDRRRVIKDRLLHVIVATALDTWLAVGALRGRLGQERPGWKGELSRLESAFWSGDADRTRAAVAAFFEKFQGEPLLFNPLSSGGHPRQILRATRAQTLLRALASNLPRLGLLPETLTVVQRAQEMERRQPLPGQRVTEFDRLFQTACQAAAEAVVEAARGCDDDGRVVALLERLVQPYLPLWREHSRTLRVSMLEVIATETEWSGIRQFIQDYGRELFHVQFMSLGNLRGILHRGIRSHLDYLAENADPLHPVRLLEDIESGAVSPADVERRLGVILQSVIENYEIYKDYNSTAPQSDYGENLYILLDFLRLKASYERQAWQFRPLVHVHEVLARHRPSAAVAWQERFTAATRAAADLHLEKLAELQRAHGIRLNTVQDRLQERFVRPLSLDRLCALVEPTMKAADTPEAGAALRRFEEELQPYLDHPAGVGLDVPHWLHRLEAAVHQTQAAHTAIAGLAEDLLQIPRAAVPLDDLERQLAAADTVSSSSNFWAWMLTLLTPGNQTLPGPMS